VAIKHAPWQSEEIRKTEMRVSDLQEFSTTSKKIDRVLKAKGYKKLGAGVDQTAYLEPGTGYVLKVFGTQGGESFSADHKMFFTWAKYCMKNSNNPFLPRFVDYESFVLDGDRYLQIRQEALKPLGVVGQVLELLATAIEEDGIRTLPEAEEFIEDFNERYIPALKKLKQQLGPGGLESMFNTILRLYKMGSKNGWFFDLHSGNFMQRPNGTPVIVDPWAL
jgi:hypothetical protein